MVFPFDVNKVVINSGKIAGENKVQAIIVGFALGSIVTFFGLDYICNTILGLGIGVTVAVFCLVFLIVGVLVFRYILFDEDSKRKELESSESDSFAKYMWLRSGEQKIDVSDKKVSAFEYVNGSTMCVLELRFGSNDNSKAKNTALLNERMMQIASDCGIETRITDVPEDFRNSEEFRKHIDAINSIKDKDAAKNVMIINDAIMEESCRLCNVDVIYFEMRTINNYQKADLEVALKKIFSLMRQNVSAYRSVKFLNSQELMEFFRVFYRIAAIDLSMMRTLELAQQVTDEFQGVVSILQIQTKSGKVFETNDKILSEDEARVINS